MDMKRDDGTSYELSSNQIRKLDWEVVAVASPWEKSCGCPTHKGPIPKRAHSSGAQPMGALFLMSLFNICELM